MIIDRIGGDFRDAPEDLIIAKVMVKPDHAADKLVDWRKVGQQRSGKKAEAPKILCRTDRG
jgi:hypothetical protein